MPAADRHKFNDLFQPPLAEAGYELSMILSKEQRIFPRQPISIEATAVSGDGLIRVPLKLVNLSRSGAMVELEDDTELAEELVLLFNHTAEPCRLVWQQGQLAGLQFIDLV
jgi:hypothetical protein